MEKHYIGVDLHKAFFQACAVRPDGARAWEDRFPRTEEGLAAFRGRCDRDTAVAVEASTPTWHFADAIEASVIRAACKHLAPEWRESGELARRCVRPFRVQVDQRQRRFGQRMRQAEEARVAHEDVMLHLLRRAERGAGPKPAG